MGVADLIPGISGATVAWMCGIYDSLLESIKSLKMGNIREIQWGFLLPLFFGIGSAILIFSRLMHYLLNHFRTPVFAFFFGCIAAAILCSLKEVKMKHVGHFSALLLGAAIAFFISGLPTNFLSEIGFFGIVGAAMVGAVAMLLPGISGSFVLQVLGVYQLVINSLNQPFTAFSLKLLCAMAMGISLSFILFSRAIALLLKYYHAATLSLMIGFMGGGLRALWPFTGSNIYIPLIAMILGFASFSIFCYAKK